MNRSFPLLILAGLALAGCSAPGSSPTAKVDPTTESWYPETTQRLTTMVRTAEQLFRNGNSQEAAAIVTSGISLQTRLLSAPRPTLEAMEAVADLDQLYGQMLISNGSPGEACMLMQKNVTRWKLWKPRTPEIEERFKKANEAMAECNRHMGA